MEITTTMIVDDDHEIREFTCFTCRKRFPLISDLTKHLKSEHTLTPIEGAHGERTPNGAAADAAVESGAENGVGGDEGAASKQIALYCPASSKIELDDAFTPPGQREKKFFCG